MGDATTFSLDQIRVAEPCPVEWASMQGDDRVRHCRHCDLSVHNLSAMTRPEVESLIDGAGDRLCVTYLHRDDGIALARESRRTGSATTWAALRLLSSVLALLGLGALTGCGCTVRTGGRILVQPEPTDESSNTVPDGQPPAEVRHLGRMRNVQ